MSLSYKDTKFNLGALAISRIIFFGALLIHYLLWIPTYQKFFQFSAIPHLSFFVTTFFMILVIVSSLLCTLGLFARWATLIVFVSHLFFLQENLQAFWGWGSSSLVIILIHFFGVNNLRFTLKKERSLFKSWIPIYLLLAYASLIYLTSNLLRINKPDWHEGNVLYYLLLDPMFSHFPQFNYLEFKSFFIFLNHLSWVFELSGIILVFLPFRKLRIFLGSGLILLHFSILVLAKIQIWSPVMIAMLVLSWAHFEWDLNFKKVLRPSFAILTIFYGIYAFYVIQISIFNKTDRSNPILEVLRYSDLGGLRSAFVFQVSPHRLGLSYEVYGLDKDYVYQPIFKSNPSQYTGERSNLFSEPITAYIDRLAMNPSDYRLCFILNHLFSTQQKAFLIRYISLRHFENKGAMIDAYDIVFNCSKFETILADPPERNIEAEKALFLNRVKQLGLKL